MERRHHRGEVLLRRDALDERAVDPYLKLLALPSAHLDVGAGLRHTAEDERTDRLRSVGLGRAVVQVFPPRPAQLLVVDPFVQQAVETRAGVEQPVLDPPPHTALELGALVLVLEVVVVVDQRLELLAQRQRLELLRAIRPLAHAIRRLLAALRPSSSGRSRRCGGRN